MQIIGFDLHKRESQLGGNLPEGLITERRIVTSRGRFAGVPFHDRLSSARAVLPVTPSPFGPSLPDYSAGEFRNASRLTWSMIRAKSASARWRSSGVQLSSLAADRISVSISSTRARSARRRRRSTVGVEAWLVD
jgi:hypothetical protein